jgi:hypothetical protein
MVRGKLRVVDHSSRPEIELLERTTRYNYAAICKTLITEANVKHELNQLELKEQALAKLTKEEREALGHFD